MHVNYVFHLNLQSYCKNCSNSFTVCVEMNVFYVVILKYDDISYLDEHGILCRLYSYLNVLYDVDDSKHYCSCKT